MKVVILCGGKGTRLSEETVIKPKPMVEVGGFPILWHIMKHFSMFGYNDFILALGYKGDVIKDYFINYHPRNTETLVDLKTGHVEYGESNSEQWRVRLVDTGLETMTGGRLAHLAPYLKDDKEPFFFTYGDGISNVDISALVKFHKNHGKQATVTAVHPPARFGGMAFDGDQVSEFKEKPQTEGGWINGGFFILEPGVFNYLGGNETIFEQQPLERLAAEGQLMAHRHNGFWQCMDTLRDKNNLEKLWQDKKALWKIW